MPKADPQEVTDMMNSLGDWVEAIGEVDKVLESEAKDDNEVPRPHPGPRRRTTMDGLAWRQS